MQYFLLWVMKKQIQTKNIKMTENLFRKKEEKRRCGEEIDIKETNNTQNTIVSLSIHEDSH